MQRVALLAVQRVHLVVHGVGEVEAALEDGVVVALALRLRRDEPAHLGQRALERERKAQKRRERSCLVGVISLLIWVSSLVLILWQFADDSQILFP